MKSRFFCLAVSLLVTGLTISSLNADAQTSPNNQKPKVESRKSTTPQHLDTSTPQHLNTSQSHNLASYSSLWKSIDSLVGQGLPKSALELVGAVYRKAQQEDNTAQYLKAVIYRAKLNADYREESLLNSIYDVQKELAAAKPPATQVLTSVLAELYDIYYRQNRWRFRDRTALAGSRSDSVQYWDASALLKAIKENYLHSLDGAGLLKSISIRDYEPIVEYPKAVQTNDPLHAAPEQIRPTLYDFLVWRALDYLMAADPAEVVPANSFLPADPAFLGQTADFIRVNLQKAAAGSDTSGNTYAAIRIFQALSAFHFNDKDPAALIDEELTRFDYLHKEIVYPNKDSLYLTSLERFEENYRFSPFSADIAYARASFTSDLGANYGAGQPEAQRWILYRASRICQAAIDLFPGSRGADNCRILYNLIAREQKVQITAENAVIPGKPSPGKLDYRNLKVANFRIYAADAEKFPELIASKNREEQLNLIQQMKVLKVWTLQLPLDTDYREHGVEFAIPGLPAGFYVLLCTGEPTPANPVPFAFTSFFSTRISYLTIPEGDGSMTVFLPDRESGKPLSGVAAEAFFKSYDYQTRGYKTIKLGDYRSDAQGLIRIADLPKNFNNRYFFLKLRSDDELFITRSMYQEPKAFQDETPRTQTHLFTDRAIYRPGQTIYYKGIQVEKTVDSYRILANSPVLVQFTDANGQKVSEQQVTTNEFGSFTGSFTAPQGVLTGTMHIFTTTGSVNVNVEEYKRPTFDINFEPLTGNYRLGEEITVRGKAMAFAGNAVDGATVKYRVVRVARFPYWEWRWPVLNSPETEIAGGVLTSGSDGSFSVAFRAQADLSVDPATQPVFSFTVTADVTDLNGETHHSETVVSVGYQSLLLVTDVSEQINLADPKDFRISSTNLNGSRTPVSVNLTLQRLVQPEVALRERQWGLPDRSVMSREEFKRQFPNDPYLGEDRIDTWAVSGTVAEKQLNTAADSVLRIVAAGKTENPSGNGIIALEPGIYRLSLKATDPFGQAVTVTKIITVFDPAAKQAVRNTPNWFVPLKTECKPGEKAAFLIGSSEKGLTVLYELRISDSLVSREFLKTGGGQTLIEIPIRETYRGNLSVNFIFVYDNRIYQNHSIVKVPYPDKKLDFTVTSFRDRMQPGGTENWTMTVKNAAGKAAAAEFLASMYDASLDAFVPHNWAFSLPRNYFSGGLWSDDDAFRFDVDTYYPFRRDYPGFRENGYGTLNWFGMPFGGGYMIQGMRAGTKSMAMDGEASPSVEMGGIEKKTESTDESVELFSIAGKPASVKPIITTPSIRRDFRETAFFYPTLLTDTAGNLLVSFTVPESLTKWKFQGFAHTKELDYGQIMKEAVTQKDLMVFPNAPRFVRQGDTAVFSTKVSNLSGRTLEGEVRLELEDGISGKVLQLAVGGGQWAVGSPFKCGVGESAVVSWTLVIPVDASLNLLKYRVTAIAGSFSDGEEKTIPVLTNRMMVTESLPLPVTEKGTHVFTFDKLLKSGAGSSLKNYRLTLEYASNPAWYAVQALPVLDEPNYPSADNLFRVFYANSLASYIAHSNPKIQQVFESWKQLSPDALLSNLEKNSDLKSSVLEATPWVVEATSESARKQRIALLFDVNNIGNRLQQSLVKLRKLQTINGGWCWFEGMPENRYMTQEIVTGLGRLMHLGVSNIRDNGETREMTWKAVAFLDGEMLREYRDIRKYNPGKLNEDHLGATAVQYLYARSFFLKEMPLTAMNAETREAFDYFKQQSVKYWLNQNRYLQGMISLALNRLGEKTVPGNILRSLSEKALHSREMGMYWAGLAGYSWYEAPVETQALLIEAYDEVLADTRSVNEMKVWLLKQKQTQDWKSSSATAEACYALLLRGTDLLGADPKVSVKVGNEVVESKQAEAGTGYFRTSWDGSAITPAMGTVTVTTDGDGPAWGALYWQYFENLDKITPAQTPLKLTKELFRERNSEKGPVLEKMLDAGYWMVGDKITVRITLSVDRNLEYVHMKDLRASGFEPAGVPVSGYRWQDGLGYYQSTGDVATNFFFDYLPKGTYVFEYPLVVNAAGEYSNGITSIQCLYAPEFAAHSEGIRVSVNPDRASKP